MLRLDWPLDQDGYEIVEVIDYQMIDGELGPCDYIKGKGGPMREYTPLNAGMPIHRILAELDEDGSPQSDVVTFCNDFGLLDHTTPASLPPYETTDRGGIKIRYRSTGEAMPTREMLSLDQFWYLQQQIKDAVISLDAGNKREVVLAFNARHISVTPLLEYREISPHQHWSLVPRDLHSAIWLLIEGELAGETRWRRCRNCASWFIPPTARRTYCKDACRVAFNRKKEN